MADTSIKVFYKPNSKTTLEELKNHVELLESLADASVAAPVDIVVGIEKDYDDDSDVITALWDI